MSMTLPRVVRKERDPDEVLKLARAGASAERCVRTFLDADGDRAALDAVVARIKGKFLGKGNDS